MMNSIKYIFKILLLLSFVVGCASKLSKTKTETSDTLATAVDSAQWETKAQIKNLKRNKSQNLSIDLFAVKDSKARLEVAAMLGYQVASVVMDSKNVAISIYPQKVHYTGATSERSLYRVLGISIDPMNLVNIAFDLPVRGPGWVCSQDGTGIIKDCNNEAELTSITWSERSQGKKKVTIASPRFEMIWLFGEPNTAFEMKPEIFSLKRPNGFREINLN